MTRLRDIDCTREGFTVAGDLIDAQLAGDPDAYHRAMTRVMPHPMVTQIVIQALMQLVVAGLRIAHRSISAADLDEDDGDEDDFIIVTVESLLASGLATLPSA